MMGRLVALTMLVFALSLVAQTAPKQHGLPSDHGLATRRGHSVTLLADDKLVPDIYCMALGPRGEIVVSGRGYIRQLVFGNKSWKAERALDFAGAPRDGAMGLCWDGKDLYCVGDGGLRVYRDAAGKGRTQPPELLFACRTGSEHRAHAVKRGPDGWLYLLVGDQTGITKKHITSPTSPIRDPIGGCVLRFSPDFKRTEVVADGLRNAYAMDFNEDGELFTYDSDNERCVSLPWYEPTRCYHLVPGGNAGWMAPQHAATWRKPPHFLDVVPPIATLGRGSPTGVAFYPYRDGPGLYLLDWTFGNVHFVVPARQGSSYRGTTSLQVRSIGDNGFAPTAAAVGNDGPGSLYLSIGGRGTRGAVYWVVDEQGRKGEKERLRPVPTARRSLDWRAGLGEQLVREAGGKDRHARRRALELAWRHRERLTAAQREAMICANAGEEDRLLRQATARLLASLDAKEQGIVARHLTSARERTTLYLASPSFDAADLLDAGHPAAVRLDGARLVQLALGDVGAASAKGTIWEGYSRRGSGAIPAKAIRALRTALAAREPLLAAEAARALAMIEDDSAAALAALVRRLTPGAHPTDDIHLLAVIARMKAPRSPAVTRAVADALLSLDAKIVARKMNRERNWPLRLAELHALLAARDAGLNKALLAHPHFGRAEHVVFTRARGIDRPAAAATFLRASRREGFEWSGELVALVGELPAEKALPPLRKLWGEVGLDDAILPVLAKHAREADRPRFQAMLTAARPGTVRTALAALEKLPAPRERAARGEEAQALLRAMRLVGPAKEEEKLRARLLARVVKVAGQKLPDEAAAVAWLTKGWPKLAAALGGSDGVDVVGWTKRLAKVDWERGDPTRGKQVYTRASCAACHAGASALGPDLAGVAGRFSRDDLFTAIIQPSKDVSPRYRTTQLTTAGGQVYQGLIVYEAVDSVLLLTGAGQSVRLAHQQVSEKKPLTTSLMPAGLLDRLTDAEIADLYAYLRSLKSTSPAKPRP